MEKTESYWQGVLSSYIGRDLPELTPKQHLLETTQKAQKRVLRAEYIAGRRVGFGYLRSVRHFNPTPLILRLEKATKHSRFGFFQVYDFVECLSVFELSELLQYLLDFSAQVPFVKFYHQFASFEDYAFQDNGWLMNGKHYTSWGLANEFDAPNICIRFFLRSYKERI